MTNQIVTKENDFLSVIQKLALSQDIDASKIEKFLDMQERVMAKNAEIAFHQAMSRLQPKLPFIYKSKTADKSKYARYEDIEKQVRPLYTAEGFSIFYTSRKEEAVTTYIGTLSHQDGYSIKAEMVLPADKSGSKNDIQSMGSSMSYAKRYLLCMLLNIVTTEEDDDGQSAYQFIDTERAAEIDARIRALKTAGVMERFLKHMKVSGIQEIRVKDYLKAINAIESMEKIEAKK